MRSRSALASAFERALVACPHAVVTAAVVRTLPNDDSKRTREYSGTLPPYLTLDAAQWLASAGVQHLVVDLPSVDREVRRATPL